METLSSHDLSTKESPVLQLESQTPTTSCHFTEVGHVTGKDTSISQVTQWTASKPQKLGEEGKECLLEHSES